MKRKSWGDCRLRSVAALKREFSISCFRERMGEESERNESGRGKRFCGNPTGCVDCTVQYCLYCTVLPLVKFPFRPAWAAAWEWKEDGRKCNAYSSTLQGELYGKVQYMDVRLVRQKCICRAGTGKEEWRALCVFFVLSETWACVLEGQG